MSVVISGDIQELGSAEFCRLPGSFVHDQTSRFTEEGLARAVKRIEPGSLLLAQKEFKALDEFDLRARFVEDRELAFGRDKSAHGLYFGQLILGSVSDHERTEMVAIKPFEHDDAGAVHEALVARYANALSPAHKRAFTPLGFYRDEAGVLSYISRYEHHVKSFDAILWADPVTEPEALTAPKIQKAVRLSLYGLGLVHGLGLQHGDAQAKNLGTDNEKVRLIDLEEARTFARLGSDPQAPVDHESARFAVISDVDTFLGSCFRNEGSGEEDNPGNILEVGEAILDVVDGLAPSYVRGVCRASHIAKNRFPEASQLSEADVTQMAMRAVNEALEKLPTDIQY